MNVFSTSPSLTKRKSPAEDLYTVPLNQAAIRSNKPRLLSEINKGSFLEQNNVGQANNLKRRHGNLERVTNLYTKQTVQRNPT